MSMAKIETISWRKVNIDFRRLRNLLSVPGPLALNLAQIAVERDTDDSVECVELLSRDPRVDWSRRSERGETPLMFCIKNNKTEMVEIIGGISGIRSTVTESGLSFMRDFITRKREEMEKHKEKLNKLESQFGEKEEVEYNLEYVKEKSDKKQMEMNLGKEKNFQHSVPGMTIEIKKKQKRNEEHEKLDTSIETNNFIELEPTLEHWFKEEDVTGETEHKKPFVPQEPKTLEGVKLWKSQPQNQTSDKKCPKCEKVFLRKSSMMRHYISKHEGIKYPCNQCDYKATQEAVLQRHIDTIHEGIKYPCILCDYQASRQDNLQVHIKSKHEGIKYHCNKCGNQFTTQQGLERHIQSKHDGIKYPCNLCDYQFKHLRNLTAHIRSKHLGIKVQCNQCNYQAATQSNLQRHIQSVHEGTIKYPCKLCTYQATQKGDLLRHFQSQHERIKYPCNLCDYQATLKGNLKKHIESKHKVIKHP